MLGTVDTLNLHITSTPDALRTRAVTVESSPHVEPLSEVATETEATLATASVTASQGNDDRTHARRKIDRRRAEQMRQALAAAVSSDDDMVARRLAHAAFKSMSAENQRRLVKYAMQSAALLVAVTSGRWDLAADLIGAYSVPPDHRPAHDELHRAVSALTSSVPPA